jgi:hypothetical protein
MAICAITDRWFKASGDSEGVMRGGVQSWREKIAETMAE